MDMGHTVSEKISHRKGGLDEREINSIAWDEGVRRLAL
jgi:hypothetical protein